MISFEDFEKLDLRVGKIIEAVRVEVSDKLVQLKVDVGEEERQLVAGILTSYGIEDLPGRSIVVVTNLEPRSMMGIESQGMLLAADGAEGPVLLMPDYEVPPGSKVR